MPGLWQIGGPILQLISLELLADSFFVAEPIRVEHEAIELRRLLKFNP